MKRITSRELARELREVENAVGVVLEPFIALTRPADCRLARELIVFAVAGPHRGWWKSVKQFETAASKEKRFARAFGLPPLPPIDPAVIAMIVQMITAMMANKPV